MTMTTSIVLIMMVITIRVICYSFFLSQVYSEKLTLGKQVDPNQFSSQLFKYYPCVIVLILALTDFCAHHHIFTIYLKPNFFLEILKFCVYVHFHHVAKYTLIYKVYARCNMIINFTLNESCMGANIIIIII